MNVQEVFEQIKVATLVEVNQLTEMIEKEFGVTPMMAAAPVAAAPVAAAEEKTEFDVILASAGEKKIPVIKVVRQVTELGLKEAKDLVDSAPAPIKTGVSKEDAAELKAKLEEAGATVELK